MKEMDYNKILKALKDGNMPVMHYCETCGLIKETYTDTVKETFEINKESFEVEGLGLFCAKCKQRINNVEMDDKLLMAAYDKYREKYGYLMPSEIKQIRESYGLSAKQFAQILGMGDHAIYNYESGALQSVQHDSLIKYVANPINMKEFLINNQSLSKKSIEKVMERIGRMCLVQQLCNKNSYNLQFMPSFSLSIG